MPRLAFAHQLRGIAALLIVITHYFGVYFGAQHVVAEMTASPNLQFSTPAWVPYLDFPILKGPFGVAVFFLISGFVIPFSLQHNSMRSFLVARLLRIYPTYLACFGIGLLAVWLGSHYWGSVYAPSSAAVLQNALLVHNLFGTTSLDPANWTLAIEIKFYLLAACAAPALLRPRPAILAALVTGVLGLTLVLPATQGLPGLHPFLAGLAHDLKFIVFMLMGVLFYQHYRQLLSTQALTAGLLLLSAAFAAAWLLGPERDSFAIIGRYYFYALVVFSASYIFRARFRRLPVLDFLADISYPLYVVHALAGFTLLKLAMALGLPFGPAVSLVIGLIILLSWLVHVAIETPSNKLGKKMAGALHRPAANAA